MSSILQRHRDNVAERGPLGIVTAEDRLAVLEEAVAGATGRTVESLRAEAGQRAGSRRAGRA